MKFIASIMSAVLLLVLFPVKIQAEAPSLANGRFEKWNDRIKGWPDYAEALYDWLEDNCGPEGALVDVGKAQYVNGAYVYEMAQITDTIHMSDEGVKDVPATVYKKLEQTVQDNFSDMCPYIFAAYNTFLKDHPEVFWLSGESFVNYTCSSSYIINGNDCAITYTQYVYFDLQTDSFDIRSSEYRDVDVLAAEILKRDEQIDTIISQCVDFTRYEQIQYLNKWLTEHNSYNTDGNVDMLPRSALECINALKGSSGEKGPVCSGYARAFKVLCDRLNIPCVLVDGDAVTEHGTELHEWNYVQMEDGKWYAVDVTWNDPTLFENSNVKSGSEHEKYLLVGENTRINDVAFRDSHKAVNNINDSIDLWNGPALEKERCQRGQYILTKQGDLCYFRNGRLYARYKQHVALK